MSANASAPRGPYFRDYFNQPTRAEIGTVVAILEIGALISSLCVGKIGDLLGRRKTVLYGSIVFFIGGAFQTLANGMPMMMLGRIIAEIAHADTGIDIHPGATIGRSFFIDHGTGVVIGETAIIGERVRIYQAVTLGAKRFESDDEGKLLKGQPRHPIVEDDVVIYAGATILGRITIGAGSIIGGNVWVTRSLPPGSNVSQASLKNRPCTE